jgi:hypothetical protein
MEKHRLIFQKKGKITDAWLNVEASMEVTPCTSLSSTLQGEVVREEVVQEPAPISLVANAAQALRGHLDVMGPSAPPYSTEGPDVQTSLTSEDLLGLESTGSLQVCGAATEPQFSIGLQWLRAPVVHSMAPATLAQQWEGQLRSLIGQSELPQLRGSPKANANPNPRSPKPQPSQPCAPIPKIARLQTPKPKP